MKGHVRDLCSPPSPPGPARVSVSPKPIMPGAFDRTRPSEPSLLSRIGTKIEYNADQFSETLRSAHDDVNSADLFGPGDSMSQVDRAGFSKEDASPHNMTDRSLAQLSNFASSSSASSLSHQQLRDLLEVCDAAPLAHVFEIAAKYAQYVEDVATQHGFYTSVVDHHALGFNRPAAESGSVWLVMGRSRKAVNCLLDASTKSLMSGETPTIALTSQREVSVLVDEMKKMRKGGCGTFLQLMVAGALGGVAMFYALTRI